MAHGCRLTAVDVHRFNPSQRAAPLSAEERGAALGEAPLPSLTPKPPPAPGDVAAALGSGATHDNLTAGIAVGDKSRLQAIMGSSFTRYGLPILSIQ